MAAPENFAAALVANVDVITFETKERPLLILNEITGVVACDACGMA
jgi:hypothetical protein